LNFPTDDLHLGDRYEIYRARLLPKITTIVLSALPKRTSSHRDRI